MSSPRQMSLHPSAGVSLLHPVLSVSWFFFATSATDVAQQSKVVVLHASAWASRWKVGEGTNTDWGTDYENFVAGCNVFETGKYEGLENPDDTRDIHFDRLRNTLKEKCGSSDECYKSAVFTAQANPRPNGEWFQRMVAEKYPSLELPLDPPIPLPKSGELLKTIPIIGLNAELTDRLYNKPKFYKWMSENGFGHLIPPVYLDVEKTDLKAKVSAEDPDFISQIASLPRPFIVKPDYGCGGNLAGMAKDGGVEYRYPVISQGDENGKILAELNYFVEKYPGHSANFSAFLRGGDVIGVYFVFDGEKFLNFEAVTAALRWSEEDNIWATDLQAEQFDIERDHPGVKDEIQRVLQKLQYKGIGGFEYKLSPVNGDADVASRMQILEINPRVQGRLKKQYVRVASQVDNWISMYASASRSQHAQL